LEGVEQVVPYEYIRELLGFQKGAPEQVDVHGGTLEGFWSMITGEAHQQRNSIWDPIIQMFHSWMCKRILGRMRETKVTDMEVNWLWLGVLYLHVGYLFETGYYKKPEACLTRDFPRIIRSKANTLVEMREEASKWPS
jgi:hypothetical protein